jgi:hypothetical protein
MPRNKELHVEMPELAVRGRIELRYDCPACGRPHMSVLLGSEVE